LSVTEAHANSFNVYSHWIITCEVYLMLTRYRQRPANEITFGEDEVTASPTQKRKARHRSDHEELAKRRVSKEDLPIA
jgi:hypothetical protein